MLKFITMQELKALEVDDRTQQRKQIQAGVEAEPPITARLEAVPPKAARVNVSPREEVVNLTRASCATQTLWGPSAIAKEECRHSQILGPSPCITRQPS